MSDIINAAKVISQELLKIFNKSIYKVTNKKISDRLGLKF